MKTARKAILLVLCAILLVVSAVMGTLAYLTDTEAVTNTFTVGKVGITLDEAKTNKEGKPVDDDDTVLENVADAPRVTGNEYHLLPGHTYTKDPTVTVDAESEESYVRMMVTFNFSVQLDNIFALTGANMTSIFNGYDSDNWALHDVTEDAVNNTRTYEFRYVGTDNAGTKTGTVRKTDTAIKLDALFDSFTIPGAITKEQLATLVVRNPETNEIESQFKIIVEAHAIQADGFANADAAWAAFTPTNS